MLACLPSVALQSCHASIGEFLPSLLFCFPSPVLVGRFVFAAFLPPFWWVGFVAVIIIVIIIVVYIIIVIFFFLFSRLAPCKGT